MQDGLPGDNHFVMPPKHPPGEGLSTGIASMISISELRSIESIQQICGNNFGIAELNVAEVLSPVFHLGISVVQQDDPVWGSYAKAHAVVTGYQALHGNQGRRHIRDFQRHLVNLARKRYYPAGSGVPIVTE
jgi:hypothetical protein